MFKNLSLFFIFMMQSLLEKIKNVYETKYLLFLCMTFCLLFASLGQIFYQYTTTGEFIHKGVSLKGGTTITVPLSKTLDTIVLQNTLQGMYPENEITIRKLRGSAGELSGIVIDVDSTEQEQTKIFVAAVSQSTGVGLDTISVEMFGSRFSENFFKELFIGMIVAFLFMGCVVFLYFRDFIPSIAVMLAASSDIIITLAVTNIIGLKLSTAGIAAFLMLIGYSIDTDILLTIRVMKQKDDGSLNERIYGALKTGGLMTITAIAAVGSVLLFTNSDVLFQIVLILFIGLSVDLMTTWIQNVCILRWYFQVKKGDGA